MRHATLPHGASNYCDAACGLAAKYASCGTKYVTKIPHAAQPASQKCLMRHFLGRCGMRPWPQGFVFSSDTIYADTNNKGVDTEHSTAFTPIKPLPYWKTRCFCLP